MRNALKHFLCLNSQLAHVDGSIILYYYTMCFKYVYSCIIYPYDISHSPLAN